MAIQIGSSLLGSGDVKSAAKRVLDSDQMAVPLRNWFLYGTDTVHLSTAEAEWRRAEQTTAEEKRHLASLLDIDWRWIQVRLGEVVVVDPDATGDSCLVVFTGKPDGTAATP